MSEKREGHDTEERRKGRGGERGGESVSEGVRSGSDMTLRVLDEWGILDGRGLK